MRTVIQHGVVVLVLLARAAHAMSDDTIEGVLTYVAPPPDALSAELTFQLVESRLGTIERGLRETKHPLARANLVLARADLLASRALLEGLTVVNESTALVRAFRDYRSLLGDPKLAAWKNLDAAMFRFGWMLDASGNELGATEMYRKVADRGSPYRARALLELAEDELDAKQNPLARAHYDELLKDRTVEPELRAYALYKRGFTLPQLGEESFSGFAEAITLSPPPLLAKQLRHVIVDSFARFGKPEDAFATFHRLAPDHALDMLHDLAESWMSTDREADASLIANELVRRDPDNRLACRWAELSVRAMHTHRLDARIVVESEKLVRVFERVRARGVEPAVVEQCLDATRHLTLDVARDLSKHLWDRETAYFVSARLYDLYLGAFPEDTIARRERVNLRPQFLP